MAGRAPGTCSSELPPLDPRDDMEPAQDNYGILKNLFAVRLKNNFTLEPYETNCKAFFLMACFFCPFNLCLVLIIDFFTAHLTLASFFYKHSSVPLDFYIYISFCCLQLSPNTSTCMSKGLDNKPISDEHIY